MCKLLSKLNWNAQIHNNNANAKLSLILNFILGWGGPIKLSHLVNNFVCLLHHFINPLYKLVTLLIFCKEKFLKRLWCENLLLINEYIPGNSKMSFHQKFLIKIHVSLNELKEFLRLENLPLQNNLFYIKRSSCTVFVVLCSDIIISLSWIVCNVTKMCELSICYWQMF